MSWLKERQQLPWYHRVMVEAVKCGPIPKHVAFIMDGNRRYARKKHLERNKGHGMGFETLARVGSKKGVF